MKLLTNILIDKVFLNPTNENNHGVKKYCTMRVVQVINDKNMAKTTTKYWTDIISLSHSYLET